MEISKIGVIGAGQMGNGIAHVLALAGYEVLLNDISQDALARAMEQVRANLDRQVSRGKVEAADRDAARDLVLSLIPEGAVVGYGDSLTLRPEGTAGCVRAMLQHGLLGGGVAQKVWYNGPMFRHERPQKGRYRQFHQIDAEILGAGEPQADVDGLRGEGAAPARGGAVFEFQRSFGRGHGAGLSARRGLNLGVVGFFLLPARPAGG